MTTFCRVGLDRSLSPFLVCRREVLSFRSTGIKAGLRGLLVLLLLGMNAGAIAVTVSASPSQTGCTSVTGPGVTWQNPTRAYVSDNNYATATVRATSTEYLKCVGYGFTIPGTATINGITVNVERNINRTDRGSVVDAAMQLVKAGAIQATDYSTTTAYTTITNVYVPYGGAADSWGTTWLPTDINNANFGAAFAADGSATTNNVTVNVDHIQIVVDYTFAAPTVTKSFGVPTIATNGTSTLTITLTNPNATAITGAAFTDNYPANLKNASPSNVGGTCVGTKTGTAGGATLSLSAGTIPASGSCTVTVDVTSAVAGTYNNPTSAMTVTSTNAGSGTLAANAATLTVLATVVTSINCSVSCAATSAATVSWTVTFSRSVTGVSASAFSLAASSGLSGAYIATVTVTGSGTIWTVTANTGIGSGTLGLNQTGPGSVVPTLSGTFTGDVYPITATPALAEYRMDEARWNGTANEVADSSLGGLYPAIAVNGASTTGGSASEAIPGNPGTCRYGGFNGGYVQTPLPNLTTDFTITAWIRTTDKTAVGQRILIDDQSNSGGYGFSFNDEGAGVLRFFSRGITPISLDSTYLIANNTWYFVAAVADIANKKRTIYVFNQSGVLQNTTTEAAWTGGTWGTDGGPVSIGGETIISGEAALHFVGNLDEVRVYQKVLSQAALTAIATQTHPCAVYVPDHLVIQSSGSGLTCAASTLTVLACQDAACATPFTLGVSGTLTPSGVNWDGSTGGAAGAGFVIPVGFSSVTKNVQVPTAGSVLFGITSALPVPTNTTTRCNFGSPECTFTASSAGFIFSDTATPGDAYIIPAQRSGIATPTLYLRAVQASTTNPAVCTPAIISSTTSVNMGYACNNPATCQAGNLATITNTTTSTATAIAPGGTSVSLNFDANGSAPITARYDDVGQITLNANTTVTPFSGGTAVTLNGSSNMYVVAPDHFGFSNITSGLIKAGNNFSATVTAYNGLTTPTATGNFGKETPPEGVTLTPSLVSPVGGNNPVIGNNAIPGSEFGAFGMVNDPNGVATVNNLSWGEVGLITLTSNLTSGGYLGSVLTATGTSGNVGRFIPHHFDTVVTQPGTTYTYSGQPFTTKVTAMNFAGTPTKNYNATAGFSKDVTLSAWDSTGVTANPGPGTLTPTQPAAIVLASAFTSTSTGAATVATPTFTFSTAKTAPMTIRIRATDTDLVSSSDGVTEGSALIRSGRLRLSNAFGSEKSNLSMAVSAEYWTGLSWLLNSADSFSLIPTTAVALTPSGVVGSTVQSPVTLASGQGSIVLLKPTSGTGMVDLAINLGIGTADLSCLTTHPATTGAGLPWLRSLNGSCAATYDRDPSARATFGIYSPETRKTIHVRELYY